MKSRPTCIHLKTKVLHAPAIAVALAMVLGFNTQAFGQAPGLDGGRTIGDILLTIEFTRGGSAASFFVQFWDSIPGTNPLEYTYFDTTVSPNQAFVSPNTDSTVLAPYGAFGSTLYQVNAFGEAAININKVIPSADSCFGIATIFIRTKSS